MGWYYEYIKSKKLHNQDEECINGDKHKVEFWFGNLYCEVCGVSLKPKTTGIHTVKEES